MSRGTEKSEMQTSVHDSVFDLLTKYIAPILEEGRTHEVTSLLWKLKLLLKEKDCEQFDLYTD